MSLSALLAATDATWPAAARHHIDGWLIREGRGGGNRVSCITPETAAAEIAAAEAAAARLNQPAIFRLSPELGPEEAARDADLAARGYALTHPVVFYAAPVADLALEPPPVSAFALWPPLAIQREVWAEAGTSPARIAIMERAAEPKAALLGRSADRAAGAGFVALAGGIAMLHGLVVLPALRRQGTARHMLARAAVWAQERGATQIALAVEEDNPGALALYAAAGMRPAGRYHYRARVA